MKPAQIPSAILWSSLALAMAAAPASALNVTILEAQLNSSQTQLIPMQFGKHVWHAYYVYVFASLNSRRISRSRPRSRRRRI
jgi:hypothetical protein